MTRRLVVLVVAAAVLAPSLARGNGESSPADPPTRFERFVLSACSPCVRESYPITTVAVAAMNLPSFPRMTSAVASRAGEIELEVVRAQQLGRAGWQSLALRMTLSVLAAPGGDMYRLGIGLLDADEVAVLAQAVTEMAKLAAAPATPGAATSDVDFHGGTVRVGLFRLRGEAVAYVQAGDLPTLLQRPVWEVPTTVYLPVKELPRLAAALSQAATTLEKVRGN